MAPTKELQEKLYREMLSHIKETDESYPYHYAGYYYYSRTIEGSQYTIHCRRKGSIEAPEQIILDGNELAKVIRSWRSGPLPFRKTRTCSPTR